MAVRYSDSTNGKSNTYNVLVNARMWGFPTFTGRSINNVGAPTLKKNFII